MSAMSILIYCPVIGYCDSDVTVCLLFWNMPIIQGRDVKYPYLRYRYYLQAFRLIPVVSQWLHKCTKEGVLCGKRDGAGSNLGIILFFFFFSCSFCLFICGNVTKGSFIFCI